MATSTASEPSAAAKVDLPEKFSELQIEDILSCAKIEPASSPAQNLNDIELGDLDAKISAKLDEIKSTALLASGGTGGEGSTWLLREEHHDEAGAEKRRWLVARNVENEVELKVDLVELEAKSERS